jgi:hypothetical protein
MPVFTVNDEKEATMLVALACPRGFDGKYYAPELAQDQTFENLEAFGNRLEELYNKYINKENDDE